MYDERTVANFILDEAESRDVRLSNLALQKIIFFAHAWHLAEHNAPLVRGEFEAWQFGPVLRSIYDCFRKFRDKPITERATRLDLDTGKFVIARDVIDPSTARFVRSVLLAYASMSATALMGLTHISDSPWHQVWTKNPQKVNVSLIIPNDLIRQYFQSGKAPLPRT